MVDNENTWHFIWDFIRSKMEENLKVNGHAKLTYDHFLVLVQQWKEGEFDLFLTIKDWLDADYENRKQHLDNLMSHVRFSLLTSAQLKAVKKMKMYSEGTWRYNVQLGEDYHSRLFHKKMMHPTSVRSKPQPVCFSSMSASSIFALQENGKWTEVDVPKMPSFNGAVLATLEFNNFLVTVANDPSQTWLAFDVSTFKWSRMQSLKIPRVYFELVHDDRYLYALGGIINIDGPGHGKVTDIIERYDPGTNTWTVMSTKLPKPLYKHKACVCSRPFFSIYVAGGWDKLTNRGEYSEAMNCFNPYETSARWHRKAPISWNSEFYLMREMAFAGIDQAIIIMCADLVFQYYNIQTDQWTVSNTGAYIAKDLWWHKNGTVLADPSENTLYILNIIENFPQTSRKYEQGVCEKWELNKLNIDRFEFKEHKALPECTVANFPLQANYIVAMLAIPTPSHRKIVGYSSD